MVKKIFLVYFQPLRLWTWWVAAIILGGLPLGSVWAEEKEILLEHRIKAAFLLRLVDYTTWPKGIISPKKEFVIGILGESPLQGYLETLVARDNRKRGRNIRVQHYRTLEEVAQPQILFFGNQIIESQRTALLTMIKNKPILTVSDGKGFIDYCGIVLFFRFKKRIALGINYYQAKAQQLKISAKLLRLAKIMAPNRPGLCQ